MLSFRFQVWKSDASAGGGVRKGRNGSVISSDPMGAGGGFRSPGISSNGTASTAVANGGASPARSNGRGGGGVSLQVR